MHKELDKAVKYSLTQARAALKKRVGTIILKSFQTNNYIICMNWCVLFGSLNRKPVGRVLSFRQTRDTTHAKVLSTGEATPSDAGSDLDVLVGYKERRRRCSTRSLLPTVTRYWSSFFSYLLLLDSEQLLSPRQNSS